MLNFPLLFQALLVVLILLPEVVSAQTVRQLRMNREQTFENVADEDTFRFQVFANRSYCCSVYATDGSATGAFPHVDMREVIDNGETAAFDLSSQVRRSGRDSIVNGDRRCFVAAGASGDEGTFNQSGGLEFDVSIIDMAENPATANVSVLCEETTLYCAYNTNASPFNFLELTNLGAGDREVAPGQEPSRIDTLIFGTSSVTQEDFTFPSQSVRSGLRRVDVDLHTVVGENTFGILHISHTGSAGALKGEVGRYNVNAAGEISPVDRIACSRRSFLPQ